MCGWQPNQLHMLDYRKSSMLKQHRPMGFTLIELMIVVAILGIVVAFGYPSYRDQVIKSRRAEGMGELLELADRMERYYSDQGTYAGVCAAEIFGGSCADDSGRHSTEKGNYKLDITAQDAVSFAIEADPQGKQVADKCGKFTLTSLGAKGVSKSTVDECWK